MTTIVIGTTPTIRFKFKVISISDIVQAKLTIERNNTIVLMKTLADATIGEGTIEWKLSQSETLSIGTGHRDIMLNWVIADGTRGVSPETKVNFISNHIKEVI